MAKGAGLPFCHQDEEHMVTTSLDELGPLLDVPLHWPASLHPEVLSQLDLPTPFLVGDLRLVGDRIQAFTAAMPRVRPFYAVKCNSAPEVLRAAHTHGTGFEIASLGELSILEEVGIVGRDVLYSNTVKPAAHIAGAAERGVWRFAIDSE